MFCRCEDFRCLTWRPVGQPILAASPLSSGLNRAQPGPGGPQRALWLRLGRSVLPPFEFFSHCEDFVILAEQAFLRALVAFVCFLRASAPPRFNPPVVWLGLRPTFAIQPCYYAVRIGSYL